MNDATLQDDLAYVRSLADAGARAPLLGGRFLAFWGGITGIAYAFHYATDAGLFGWSDEAFAWIWGTYLVIGLIGQSTLGFFIRNKPGGSSVGNRAEATVWMAGGFALFAYFGTLIVKSLVLGEAQPGLPGSLPIVFAIYGTGLITSGVMGQVSVLRYAGFGALAMVALSLWFAGSAEIWAVASVGALTTVFLPGILMLRKEPKSIV